MHLSTVAFLAASLLSSASASHGASYAPLAVGNPFKRDVQTCEQSYGAGSVACGDAAHSMCFNPSQGQTCCATDHGYCDQGKYCAPVAGYCCLVSESVGDCAKNAGFSLPQSLQVSLPSAASVSIGIATYSASATGHHTAATPAPAVPTASAAPKAAPKNSTSPPYVQVSVARKEQWTLVYMTLGMGVVGLIMATF